MSRHGEIKIPWGDDEHTFRLGYGELRKLQEACDAGPPRIADRLRPYDPLRNPHGDNWRTEDIRETIRLGLIGGGMEQSAALTLIRKFVDEVPLLQNRLIAWAIIQAAVAGVPDEPLGKAPGAAKKKTKARSSRTEKSPSQESTGTAA